jgi:hypothetical protein
VDDRRIYRKYQVRRTDGSSEPGGKHARCVYFVLDIDHDPHALPAPEAYANACEAERPALARDIRAALAAQAAGPCGCRSVGECMHLPQSASGALEVDMFMDDLRRGQARRR